MRNRPRPTVLSVATGMLCVRMGVDFVSIRMYVRVMSEWPSAKPMGEVLRPLPRPGGHSPLKPPPTSAGSAHPPMRPAVEAPGGAVVVAPTAVPARASLRPRLGVFPRLRVADRPQAARGRLCARGAPRPRSEQDFRLERAVGPGLEPRCG